MYAGATILGGDTVIGDKCVIAGGVFLMRSIDADHTVRGPKAAVFASMKTAAISTKSNSAKMQFYDFRTQ